MSSHSSKRTRKLTDSSNKDTICVTCKQKATQNAIECNKCENWEHKTCAHVNDLYELINNVQSSFVPLLFSFLNCF